MVIRIARFPLIVLRFSRSIVLRGIKEIAFPRRLLLSNLLLKAIVRTLRLKEPIRVKAKDILLLLGILQKKYPF